ncbi:hypothetical protein [Methanohalophilus mahii]|uniref:hypothetical protein n=1 Tax=Methanohalophilus mahii TaxID=2176 RepID=UPI00155AA24E|nr:hypothetical protein [Methanohalophilus mahii]
MQIDLMFYLLLFYPSNEYNLTVNGNRRDLLDSQLLCTFCTFGTGNIDFLEHYST